MTTGSGSEKFFVVSAEDEGARLDLFLANLEDGLSRNMVQKLVEEGRVKINEETCYDKNHRIKGGEEISLFIPPPGEISVGPENIRLDIIYEDSDLLIINKPRGMVVHPAPGHPGGTLVNALLNHCSDLSGIGGMIRPGIIHRLDKDTSGLLIVAKNDQAHRLLSGQLKSRTLRREYIALVAGKVMPAVGRIEASIGRHPHHRKKMAVISAGREAVTRYRVLKYYGQYSLLQLNLETGRTHQIRVHLAHLGYPVIGDLTYSKRSYDDLPSGLAAPQALHAHCIRFIHPRSGEEMEFSAPLPSEFRKGLIWLSKKYPS